MATSALPSTRFIRRPRRGNRGWLVGLGLTIAANVGVIVVLTLLSRRTEPPPEEIPVTRLEVVEPPPAEPPPREPPPEPPPEIQLSLPTLDLPATPTTADFSLPAVINEGVIELPLEVPAFAALVPDAPAAPQAAPSGVELSPDQPARLPLGVSEIVKRFYPRTAKVRGIEGECRVVVDVDAEGTVTRVDVLSGTPPNVFEDATTKAMKAVRYHPAVKGGRPVPTRIDFVFVWTIEKKR